MSIEFSKLIVLRAAMILLLLPALLRADSQVTITLDADHPGLRIPDDFSGLSFETLTLLPDKTGKHLFSPDNALLIKLFRQLGVRNLRIGGNTADRPTVDVPNETDIDNLFGFARATNVKVIYTLRLKGSSDPSEAAKIAAYVMGHYRSSVACLAIGNEPNVYEKTYEPYQAVWKKYLDAITAPGVAPDAMFCGPSTTPGHAQWSRQFAADFGPTGKIAFVSQHAYPGGGGNKVSDPSAGRDKLLSPKIFNSYQSMQGIMVSATAANHLAYRLEETNSFFNGGAKNVSDTFASALWALDYMHWWAAHGAAGLNFHTGDSVAAGNSLAPCYYATYWTSPGGYRIFPVGYALKAFSVGGHGRIIPVTITSTPSINLTAYGVLDEQQNLCITIINKEHSPGASASKITLSAGNRYHSGEMMLLGSLGNDVSATSDIQLAGASIGDDASWNGKATPLPKAGGDCIIDFPPATAAIVTLKMN